MKPGGNYTQPHYDPQTEKTVYEVYVGWEKIDECDSDAEATYELHKELERRNGRETVEYHHE